MKGRSAEYDFLDFLLKQDFIGLRSYASKGYRDLLMVKRGYRPLLIEVKYYTKVDNKVINQLRKKVNTHKLMENAMLADCYPLLVFKIKRKGWLIYRLDEAKEYMVPYRKYNENWLSSSAPNFDRYLKEGY